MTLRPGAAYYLFMVLSWALGIGFVISAGSEAPIGVTNIVFGAAILSVVGAISVLPPEVRRKRIVEVIVSGAAITICSAVVIPVFSVAAESLRESSCMSSAKDLALSLHNYASDYDDRLPMASVWRDNLQPYLPDGVNPKCPEATTPYSYAFNSVLSMFNLAKAQDPDKLVAVF